MYICLRSELVSFLTIYTDICKRIRQTAPAAVGLAAKLKLFWLVTLLPWSLTVRPLNRVTDHPCHGRPANFQLATPFHSRLRVRHETDRQTTAISALCPDAMGQGH